MWHVVYVPIIKKEVWLLVVATEKSGVKFIHIKSLRFDLDSRNFPAKTLVN